MKLDKNNPLETKVETRDGRKARIICTDAVGDLSVVALIRDSGDQDRSVDYYADGRITQLEGYDNNLDLVNKNKELK